MPWRFEERTSLAVPRRGLSWRHLKASTQSTNEIRRQPGAPQPPHDKHRRSSGPSPNTLPASGRNTAPCLSQGQGGRTEETPPTPRTRSQKLTSLHTHPPTHRNWGSVESQTPPLPPCALWGARGWGGLGHGCGPRGGKLGRHGARVSEGLSLLSASPGWGDLSTPTTTTLGCSPPQAPQACHAFHFLTRRFL